MAGDEAAGPDAALLSMTGQLPFDISVANHARMYDYLLGECLD
jgi:hypothetical protein